MFVMPMPSGSSSCSSHGANRRGGEARAVQRRPEPIARATEVVPDRRRVQTRVDAAEQHAQSRRNDVGHGAMHRRRQVGLGWLGRFESTAITTDGALPAASSRFSADSACQRFQRRHVSGSSAVTRVGELASWPDRRRGAALSPKNPSCADRRAARAHHARPAARRTARRGVRVGGESRGHLFAFTFQQRQHFFRAHDHRRRQVRPVVPLRCRSCGRRRPG